MLNIDECERRVAEFEARALRTRDPVVKQMFADLADSYRNFAEQVRVEASALGLSSSPAEGKNR